MVPTAVKKEVDAKLRDKWLNRPTAEMNMGLQEWLEYKKLVQGMHAVGVKEPEQYFQLPQVHLLPAATEAPAKGTRPRHEAGTMNKLEEKYAAHLETRKRCGEILDYRFEPIKFRLAPSTSYTPDFMVTKSDGVIEFHETKGTTKDKKTSKTKPFYEDDSVVKIKVAAEIFREFKFLMVWFDKALDWQFKKYGAS